MVGDVLYSEVDLPIVELALDLQKWLDEPPEVRTAFEYCSMESDETGFVWIRPDDGGWRLGSTHQAFPDLTIRSMEEVESIVTEFVDAVSVKLLTLTGQHLDTVAGRRGGRLSPDGHLPSVRLPRC